MMRFPKLRSIPLVTLFLFGVALHLGQCNTLSRDVSSRVTGRRIENFVELEGEGDQDQIALESESDVVDASGDGDGRREILGTKTSEKSTSLVSTSTARDCPNVNKVLYPVIPVIVASLIGLIGAIIISAIARGVYKLIHENHMDDMNSDAGYGYGRRSGLFNMLGVDWRKVDFLGMTKRVLTAIDKIY